jgi:hypothetical protein
MAGGRLCMAGDHSDALFAPICALGFHAKPDMSEPVAETQALPGGIRWGCLSRRAKELTTNVSCMDKVEQNVRRITQLGPYAADEFRIGRPSDKAADRKGMP